MVNPKLSAVRRRGTTMMGHALPEIRDHRSADLSFCKAEASGFSPEVDVKNFWPRV